MRLYNLLAYIIPCLIWVNDCKAQVKVPTNDTSSGIIKLSVVDTSRKRYYWPPSDPNYVALEDSAKLVHAKNQFYRNSTGKLFEKMYAPKEADNLDAGIIEFIRLTNQDIDPMTFEIVGGNSWFARDKKHVHNYRGNDSGMFCITMEEANVKYFKLMPGDHGGIYGMDNKHVFEESDIIKHIDPLHMRVITNKEGHMVKIISGRYVYKDGALEAVLIRKK